MKNKINKYDFLIVGAGLIGCIAALALRQKNLKVLIIDNKNKLPEDNRTLAVNANSTEFLKKIDVWKYLKSEPQPIKKIIIKDYINSSPLIFDNNNLPMGNVIYNKEMHNIAWQKLLNFRILIKNVNVDFSNIAPNKKIIIDKKIYLFKKIVISVGKNISSLVGNKNILFNNGHHSYVGFFKHSENHSDTAHEIFTKLGPLAILPVPDNSKKKSTFIYSTKTPPSPNQLYKIIKKNFAKTHGKISFEKTLNSFPIIPHLNLKNKDLIYIGDSLKSIHPVAGQGWNLGVKDIQTLCNLVDLYSIDNKLLNSIYYSRRSIESTLYFAFTNLINSLYENNTSLNKNIIKVGYESLMNFKYLRSLFIKQAMGKNNLI